MKVRVITAIIGVLFVMGLVWLGGLFFTGAVTIVSLLALNEFAKMLRNVDIKIYALPAAICTAFIVIASGFYSLPLYIGTSLLAFVLLLYLILGIKQSQMTSLIYTAFGVIYFGMGFGALVLLRGASSLHFSSVITMDMGIFFILFALIGTWASDSFAYLVGRKWGKHKMAPHISPNKTVEGLLGGVVGCIVLETLFAVSVNLDIFYGFALAVIISFMAPMGDLFESYIKRACDVKDSGNLLPGHGGMMDRFDSLLFVAPSLLSALIILE